MKLTQKHARVLEGLTRGPRLASQVEGSGMASAAWALLREGYATLGDDPTVKDPPGSAIPALAYYITSRGRAALEDAGLDPE